MPPRTHLFRWPRLLALLALPAAVLGDPFKPAEDSFVVEKLPRSLLALQKTRPNRENQAAKSRSPGEALAAAREYLQIAQRTSDPAFVRYAEAVLDQPVHATNAEELFLQAVIRQHRHDFDGALSQLAQAERLAPGKEEIALLRASILLTEGRYDEVKSIFGRQLRLASNFRGLTLLFTTTSLTGGLARSEQALETAINPRGDSAEQAFAWCALAEMAVRRGNPEVAEARFRRALELEPGDSYTRTAYSDLLLAEGRAGDVLALAEPDASSEALLTRRFLAAKSSGAPVKDFAEQLRKSGHTRELALLELDIFRNPKSALAHALDNWARQKEPIDSLLVLRSAAAAHRPAAAQPVIDWLRQRGTEDQRMQKLEAELASLCAPL